MSGVAAGLSRRSWSIGSARFTRDVFASVLATGIAAVAFSHLSQEPAPPAREQAQGKNLDRLSWEVEEIPTRATRSYDSLAMFALPRIEPTAWSETPLHAEALKPNASLRSAQIERPEREGRKLAVLPPSRPASVRAAAEPDGDPLPLVRVATARPIQDGLYVLGWHVPGTDRIPALLPDGRDVVKGAAELGGKVTGMGRALAESVGLK